MYYIQCSCNTKVSLHVLYILYMYIRTYMYMYIVNGHSKTAIPHVHNSFFLFHSLTLSFFLAVFFLHSLSLSPLQDKVLSTLLSPIASLQSEGEEPRVAMETLEWLGRIVAHLASSESGCGTLLQ